VVRVRLEGGCERPYREIEKATGVSSALRITQWEYVLVCINLCDISVLMILTTEKDERSIFDVNALSIDTSLTMETDISLHQYITNILIC